jgi:hypothetical protein
LIKLETVMKKVRETAAQMMATAMQMTEQLMQMLTMLHKTQMPMLTTKQQMVQKTEMTMWMTLRPTRTVLEVQPATLPQIQIVVQLVVQLVGAHRVQLRQLWQVQLIGLPRLRRLSKKLRPQRG